jgi:hypothetical protein
MALELNLNSMSQFWDAIKRTFTDNLTELPQVMRKSPFIIGEKLPYNTGVTKIYAERMHNTMYASTRAEWDRSKQGKTQYGYEKTLYVTAHSLEKQITKMMRDGGKDREIFDVVKALTEVCPNTMELDLSHRFTFAYSTSYVNGSGDTVDTTTGDGLALASAVHPLTGSAKTYRSIIPSNPAFSKTNLETAEKMGTMPDVILTADDPSMINRIRELFNATADTATNNSGTFNVYNHKYKHIVWPRIATDKNGNVDTSKRTFWALIDSKMSDFYHAVLHEPYINTPTATNNGADFSSENWSYLAGYSDAIGIVTARWIKMSRGDGLA